jgi:hypothetical protein
MANDEHGIDLAEDTALDVQRSDDETADEAEERHDDPEDVDEAREEKRAGDDTDREAAAREQENPDAHRDDEPYAN